MGFDPVTMAATISKLTKSGQIGGETTKAVEVLPPTDVEFAETEGGIIGMISIYAFADNALADIIDNAKTVTVNFDGVDYTSKFLRDEGSGFAMGGNLALAGMGEDTGEPFFFLGTEDDPYNLTVLGIAAGTYTISIYDKTETIKPIDPKYLPYNYERKVIYDGKPTKLDLTAYGMGFSYQLSAEDMLPLSQGQDVHFAYEVDGVKTNGILGSYWFMNQLNAPVISDDENKTSLIYVAALGGTGFTVSSGQDASGLDLGEISNLKLWIELRENVPYYITSYNAPGGDAYVPFSNETAFSYSRKGLLLMRYFNGGGWGTTKHPLAVEPSYNDDRPNTMYVYDVIGTWLEFDVPNPYLTARKLEFVDGVYKPPEA